MPYNFSVTKAVDEWRARLEKYSPEQQQQLVLLAENNKVLLADHFYQQMLNDPEANAYLSHDEVKSRLSLSMQNWIAGLFAATDSKELERLAAQQVKIGEVHARISIPVHLVLRGARALKNQLHLILQQSDLSTEQANQLDRLAADIIDLAMEVMSFAFSSSHERNSRAEEAYRLFAVSQNIASEKDRQRACLLDWENHLMFDQAMGLAADQLPMIKASEFGLWFRHKGAHAFEGAPEASLILQAMERIDTTLLPTASFSDQRERVNHLREIRDQTKSIAYHLDLLFERSSELESGRDVLTRLLNRKFLPVVLGKQVAAARQQNAEFAVLAIDIDHFKNINDEFGHEAGDMVLQQLATLLVNGSRAGDYLFRLGGEEFLMLLVDVNPQNALRKAEKLRQSISHEVFRLPRQQEITLTLSIGLANFTGHPDYQQLLRRSDEALYAAKHNGRNRVVVAGE